MLLVIDNKTVLFETFKKESLAKPYSGLFRNLYFFIQTPEISIADMVLIFRNFRERKSFPPFA